LNPFNRALHGLSPWKPEFQPGRLFFRTGGAVIAAGTRASVFTFRTDAPVELVALGQMEDHSGATVLGADLFILFGGAGVGETWGPFFLESIPVRTQRPIGGFLPPFVDVDVQLFNRSDVGRTISIWLAGRRLP
jgi:hypothetical protein